jgi:hypothetical protein
MLVGSAGGGCVVDVLKRFGGRASRVWVREALERQSQAGWNPISDGDAESDFKWSVIEEVLKEYGVPPAAVRTAYERFRDISYGTHPRGRREPIPYHSLAGKWTGQNCSIFLTDIARFSSPGRNDKDRRVMRQVMYRLLRQAFEASGISWGICHVEDRGDRALIVVPPEIPTGSVIDPLLAYLAGGLEIHNAGVNDATRFQLRTALHVGPVHSDHQGVTGEPSCSFPGSSTHLYLSEIWSRPR